MFDFGNHLRMLRERYGISQEELGRRVGRAGSVISNYENNIKIPTLDVLTTMARIYNVSLDYLVGFDKKDQVVLEGMTDGQRELIHLFGERIEGEHQAEKRRLVCRPAGNPKPHHAGVFKVISKNARRPEKSGRFFALFSKVTLTPSKLHLRMVHYYLEVQTMAKTILIIEDEEAIQGVVKAFLEDEGYNVVLASDGLEDGEIP